MPKKEERVGAHDELKDQLDLILAKEREIEAQRAESIRQSMTLEKMQLEQKSKAEIEAKQSEIDQIQLQLKSRSEALLTMQAKLQELQKKEEENNQMKLRARDFMMQQ